MRCGNIITGAQPIKGLQIPDSLIAWLITRRVVRCQVWVMSVQARLDESDANAMEGGRKTVAKLEQRVRELEVELETEQHRFQETEKNMRKQERRVKELALQAEEDRKSQEQFKTTIDNLQQKVKTYKRQVEEAVGLSTFVSFYWHVRSIIDGL